MDKHFVCVCHWDWQIFFSVLASRNRWTSHINPRWRSGSSTLTRASFKSICFLIEPLFPKDLSSVKAFKKKNPKSIESPSRLASRSCWPGTEGRPGAAPVGRGTAQDEEGWVRGCRWVSSRSPRRSPEHVSSNHRLDEQRRSRADGQRWNTETTRFLNQTLITYFYFLAFKTRRDNLCHITM